MASNHGAPLLSSLLLSILVLLQLLMKGGSVVGYGTQDGSEEWGYVEVRPGAKMFWWLYRSPNKVEKSNQPWPVILWLQGGPGGSSVGVGNFQEVGPLDTSLNPRNTTWLHKAHLLFVDNPVGTGFSYVEDEALLVKSDEDVALDLVTLLGAVFNNSESLQKNPLYIVAESYGGKFAVTLGLTMESAIRYGKVKLKLGGIVLGDSWISPEDYALSWSPLLKDISRLDEKDANRTNDLAMKIKEQIANGQYDDATYTVGTLENDIFDSSHSVDFYNFMLDEWNDPVVGKAAEATPMATIESIEKPQRSGRQKYSRYLAEKKSKVDVPTFMNTVIRKKLQIIPDGVVWGGQAGKVFSAFDSDFMKPRIEEVDILLSRGIDVTVYNGQLDLICSMKGTEAWVQKLRWEGLKNFNELKRTPIKCDGFGEDTKGFVKSYKNFHFYWVMGAGHFVPLEQPCVALKILGQIAGSPSHNFLG